MEHTHQHQRNPRKGNVMCIMQVCLGPYFDLKDVTEEKEARIRAAKSKQQTLTVRNHYEEQRLLVPDDIQDATHRVHMTPCYKKFTLILARESSDRQEYEKQFLKTMKILCDFKQFQIFFLR